jgi:serine/threonine-protein kinase
MNSTDSRTAADRQVAWSGDANLFAGWKAFFSRQEKASEPPTIAVEGLPEARSTWNAREQGSEWILLDWWLPRDAAEMLAYGLRPVLPAHRHALMAVPARPAAGLFPKTVAAYPDPVIPEPIPSVPAPPNADPAALVGQASPAIAAAKSQPAPETSGAELVMNTADPRWGGDLGLFLRRLPQQSRRVRVRVTGSGSHRFTPVRLPRGLILEVRVDEPPPGVGRPSWSPDPQATGPALIELSGGALVLSNLHLRHDPASRLDSLLSVEDSHLVLARCQLTVPPDSGVTAGDLITFRAPTTRGMPVQLGGEVFQIAADRPVCRLIDTVLIANRTALRAELGRGIVAMSGCAVASDETAIQLDPTRVARDAFAADLWLDRCTVVAARSIIGLGPWRGVMAGPDAPWLLNSRGCVFVTLSDARARDAALLRVDADSYAGGSLFWQADGDAYDVDRMVAAGEAPPAPTRPGELNPWFPFWAGHHATRTVIGPHATSPRLRRRPRPGRIEPTDLILEPAPAGQRAAAGADLREIGIGARPNAMRVQPD